MGVIELESVIRKWVEQRVGVGNASNKAMDIDWHKVHFSTVSSSFTPSSMYQQQQYGGRRQSQNSNTNSQVVFTSNYENNTEEVQSHTFMMERETEAVVRTSITKGFSKSGDVGINIDVPESISKSTASFGSDVHIKQEDDNTVKHSIKWSLNSTVKAQPYTRTTATLYVTETESQFDFDAEVHIRGKVLVRMTNGASQTVTEGDIATILQDESAKGRFNPADMVTIQGKKVTWKVAGQLKFKYGISQDTSVSSEAL
ncbi:uncharacterized protein LOC124137331 [Haliotis rufescens]|uniref:uncharacterized protein LOC124137331 n=1 Tax=Haliotis rufescens TaxID=6454 RepID=UPI001EB09BAB|nr:uncharacterized protein LOC124137331 [Haliotis rufescens]